MSAKGIVETVKEGVGEAKSKVEMVVAHGKEVVKAGAQTAQAARDVVAGAGREAAEVVARTKDELKRTLKDGAAQVGERLSRIATPNRREQAAARKAEVKAKKQRSRAARESDPDAASPAA